jgi:hypothetical protein
MHSYECWVRLLVNGNTMDIKTQIRAASPFEAEQLLKAQYGDNCILGGARLIG